MRSEAKRHLVLHNYRPSTLEALSESVRRLVVGVEIDAFTLDPGLLAPGWSETVNEHRRASDIGWLESMLRGALAQGYEIYLDVKCPFGHERSGADLLRQLDELIGLGAFGGFYVISRNHRLMYETAANFRTGIIVTDGLMNYEKYLRECRAQLVVTSPLFLDEDLVERFATLGVTTVTFPPPNMHRLVEALDLKPDRIMLDLDIFEGVDLLNERFTETDY